MEKHLYTIFLKNLQSQKPIFYLLRGYLDFKDKNTFEIMTLIEFKKIKVQLYLNSSNTYFFSYIMN